jgi:hypothetical protein
MNVNIIQSILIQAAADAVVHLDSIAHQGRVKKSCSWPVQCNVSMSKLLS